MKQFIKNKKVAVVIILIIATLFVGCGNAHVHEFGEWEITKNATCTVTGEKVRTCSCGETVTQTIAAGHAYGLWVTTVFVTCEKDGTKECVCAICGDKKSEVIKSDGHFWENATCTKPKTCAACKKTEGNALGHNCVTGYCGRCHETILPKINLPKTPLEIGWSTDVIEITEITYEKSYVNDIYIYLTGEKVYGKTGYFRFNWRILDKDGYVLYSDYHIINDMRNGDKFKKEKLCLLSQYFENEAEITVEIYRA